MTGETPFDDPWLWDEESVRLKNALVAFFGLIWPRPFWLVCFALAWALFGWERATPLLQFCAGVWLLAQLAFRPRKFGAEIADLIIHVRDAIGAVARALAVPMGALMSRLNREAPMQAFAAPAPPAKNSLALSLLGAAAGFLMRHWRFVLGLAVALAAFNIAYSLARPIITFASGLLGFGRETAAELRAEAEAREQRAQEHERDVSIYAAERGAETVVVVHRVEQIVAQGQETIANAVTLGDFDALDAAYVGAYERVWDGADIAPDADPGAAWAGGLHPARAGRSV